MPTPSAVASKATRNGLKSVARPGYGRVEQSAERNRRAAVLDADGQREASIKVAEGNKEAAILEAEGEKRSNILHAEGEKEAALLEAEGLANALEKIHEVGQGLDPNTMSLQYLEVLRSLASSESTKWLIPTELTQFISSFAGQLTNGQGQGQN